MRYRALVFQLPIYASPSAWRALTFLSIVLAINDLAWMSLAVLSVSSRTTYIRLEWSKLSETCPRIRQIFWSIDIPIVVDAAFLQNIQVRMSSSGYINICQWKKEWFFSRRVKFDSGFNLMAVYEVSWHGPEVVCRFTDTLKWGMKWWKRPFWFSKKIYVTFSSNWTFPYQSGCSQVLISSKGFDWTFFDRKNKFSFFWEILPPLHWVFFWADFRSVHRFQLLNVCNLYVTLPTSHRVQSVKTFFPNWWILDWSFAEIG